MSVETPSIDLNAFNLQTTEQKMLAEMQKQTALLEVIVQQTAPAPINLRIPGDTFAPAGVTTKGKPKK